MVAMFVNESLLKSTLDKDLNRNIWSAKYIYWSHNTQKGHFCQVSVKLCQSVPNVKVYTLGRQEMAWTLVFNNVFWDGIKNTSTNKGTEDYLNL